MKKILIYQDEGVSLHSLNHLVASLSSLLASKYAIQKVNHRFFCLKEWEESTALVAFPGGRDLPFMLNLKGEGNARIRAYVEKGGRYLGICAGGYYGSAHIEFEKGGELEICGARELAFFPGKAIGPAYGPGLFRYESENGARSAKILWEQTLSHVYFNGGCFFEEAEKYPSVHILGRYADLSGLPAAAIYCQVERGAALLTGVHPEYELKEPFFKYLVNTILT